MRPLVIVVLVVLAARSAAAACPTGDTLVELGKRAFPDERRVVVDKPIPIDPARLHCADVRAAVPLVLLTYDTTDTDIVLGALVSGDTIVWAHGQSYVGTPSITDQQIVALDLDGDGKDELFVYSHKDGHMATSSDWLEVYTLGADGVPVEAPQPPLLVLGASSYKEYHCSSTMKVIAGPKHTSRLDVVGKCTGPEKQDGFPIGRHVYAFRGGQLEEVN